MAADIVDRLREISGPIVPNVCTEAADEIKRLRAGGCARDQSTTQYCAEAVRLESELAKMRSERDAARRQVCEMCEANGDFAAERQAEMRGWDCFKETSK